jgi:hypothetical protein
VEGHSLQVVKALNHKEVVWTMYGQIVKDIKMVLRNCEYWEIRHIKRDGNRAAHLLIKMSACLDSNRVWFNCFPDCIKDIVTSELLSLVMQSFLLLSVFMILMKSVSSSQKKKKKKKNLFIMWSILSSRPWWGLSDVFQQPWPSDPRTYYIYFLKFKSFSFLLKSI